MSVKSILFSAVIAILGTVASLAMWFILLFMILDHIDATTTMWVVYWMYIPVSVAFGSMAKVVAKISAKKDSDVDHI